jgi:hypothetical protein
MGMYSGMPVDFRAKTSKFESVPEEHSGRNSDKVGARAEEKEAGGSHRENAAYFAMVA